MKETKYAGTQTEKPDGCLAGESEARNSTPYFASKAKKEGFEQIARHCSSKPLIMRRNTPSCGSKELNGIGDTAEKPSLRAEGENYEWTDMYDELCQNCR